MSTSPFPVRAVLAYTARNASEVSLEVGRVYTVLDVDPRGKWFKTKRSDAPGTGWMPAAYTRPVTPPPMSAPVPAPLPENVAAPLSSPVNTPSTPSSPSSAAELPPLPLLEDGTVDVDRVPSEWKQVFKAAGVRKKDLLDPGFTVRIYEALGLPQPSSQRAPSSMQQSSVLSQASSGQDSLPSVANVNTPVLRPQRRLTRDLLESILLNPSAPAEQEPATQQAPIQSQQSSIRELPPNANAGSYLRSVGEGASGSSVIGERAYPTSPRPPNTATRTIAPVSKPIQNQNISNNPSSSAYSGTTPPRNNQYGVPSNSSASIASPNSLDGNFDAFGRSTSPQSFQGNQSPSSQPGGAPSSITRRTPNATEERSSKAVNSTPVKAREPDPRFFLIGDPFEFDRVDHPWRLVEKSGLNIADIVGEHVKAKPKGLAALTSSRPTFSSEEDRLKFLTNELSALLDDDAKLSSRPLAPRLNILRALLLLLETVYSRVDDLLAAPLRKLARDVQQSAAQSVSQDSRALVHELRNTLTSLRMIPEAAPALLDGLPGHLRDQDGQLRAVAFVEVFRSYSAQEVGNLARIKLAFTKEFTPLLRVCSQQVPDILRPILKDVGAELHTLASEVQSALSGLLQSSHSRAQQSQSALGSLQSLLRFCGKGGQPSGQMPWPQTYPVSVPSLMAVDPSLQPLLLYTRSDLKIVLDAYADHLASLEQLLISWRLAIKMLDLLHQVIQESLPKSFTQRSAPGQLLSSMNVSKPALSSQPSLVPSASFASLPSPTVLETASSPPNSISLPSTATPPRPTPHAFIPSVPSMAATNPTTPSEPGAAPVLTVISPARTPTERSCAHCGHIVTRSQARFCPACGGNLDDKPRQCLKCNAKCTLTERFCWQCGAGMDALQQTPTLPQTEVTMPRTTSKPKPLPKPQAKPKPSIGDTEVVSARPGSLDEEVAREMDELAALLGNDEGLANIPVTHTAIENLQRSSVERELEDLPQSEITLPLQSESDAPYQFESFGEQTLLDSLAELDQLDKKLK